MKLGEVKAVSDVDRSTGAKLSRKTKEIASSPPA